MDNNLDDNQRNLLELLGEIMIPPDEFDEGLRGVGFSGIIDVRNMYQPWMADLYNVGLRGVEEVSHLLFSKSFIELDDQNRNDVLKAIASPTPPGSMWTEQESASNFIANLHMDACFVYCTSPDVWKQIGFPGASFLKGGYPDFADPQS